MAREWQTITDDGKLVYRLELADNRGTLEVKEARSRYDGERVWSIYHEGIEITSGYSDLRHSLDHCNQLAEKLS